MLRLSTLLELCFTKSELYLYHLWNISLNIAIGSGVSFLQIYSQNGQGIFCWTPSPGQLGDISVSCPMETYEYISSQQETGTKLDSINHLLWTCVELYLNIRTRLHSLVSNKSSFFAISRIASMTYEAICSCCGIASPSFHKDKTYFHLHKSFL
jgi:hypothetical protein